MKTTVFINKNFNTDHIFAIAILLKKHKNIRVVKIEEDELSTVLKINPDGYFIGFHMKHVPEKGIFSREEPFTISSITILLTDYLGYNVEGDIVSYFRTYYSIIPEAPGRELEWKKNKDLIKKNLKQIKYFFNCLYKEDVVKISIEDECSAFTYIANKIIKGDCEPYTVKLTLKKLKKIRKELCKFK